MKKRKFPTTLRELLDYYPISETRAFELARVHRTTWERWKSGTRAPAATLELIRLHALGELTDPAFIGWRIAGGRLIDPNGTEYSPDMIKRLPLYARHSGQYLAMLEREEQARRDAQAAPARLRLVK